MSSKTIPFSARISLEDASFISDLRYEGAVTPSDKLRALLADVRQRQHQSADYAQNLQQMQDWLGPMKQQWQSKQQQLQQPTELMLRLLDWLPDVLALVLTQTATAEQATLPQIRQGEVALLQQFLRLNTLLLPLQVQETYRELPAAVAGQQRDLIQLAELITSFQKSMEGE